MVKRGEEKQVGKLQDNLYGITFDLSKGPESRSSGYLEEDWGRVFSFGEMRDLILDVVSWRGLPVSQEEKLNKKEQ